MLKLNYKTLTLLSIIFIFINFLSYKFIYDESEQKINITLSNHIKSLSTYYDMVLYDQKRRTKAVFESTFSDERILDIFQQANNTYDKKILNTLRQRLQTLLDRRYKILKKEGVLQYHFIFPNNVTFFRMHKPSKFNDDLSNVRLDFVEANKYKKEVHGFHKGKTSHAFRNIYPVYAKDGQYLGLLDVAFSSQILQDYMNEVGQTHTHFLVKKDIFSTKAWARNDMKAKYIQANEHKDYMIGISKYFNAEHYKKNKRNFNTLFEDIQPKIDEGKEFAIYKEVNNKIKVISFYPVKSSVTHKLSAWLVSYEDDKTIALILQDSNYYFVILFLIFSILLIFSAIFTHIKNISIVNLDHYYNKKLFSIFLIIFLLVDAGAYLALKYIKQDNIHSYIEKIQEESLKEFELLQKQNKIFSKHIFSKHIDTPQIKNLIKNNDRTSLYSLLKDDYQAWKQEFGIEQIHFHTPDSRSFLRVHKPKKHSDSLVGIRRSVEYVNKHKEPFIGFEEGRTHSSFRYIYPLFLDQTYLGCVEISFTPLSILKNISSSFGKKVNMLFNEKLLKKSIFKEYQNDYIKTPLKGFVFNKEILDFLKKHSKNITAGKKTKQEMQETRRKIFKGSIFSKYYCSSKELVTIIPLKNNFTKEIIASFHIINDVKYIEKQESTYLFFYILSSAVLLLIIILLYKSLMQKHNDIIKQMKQNDELKQEVDKALLANTKQLQILQQQNKMAAMGEMIGAIAHQWRQPLNAVSLSIQNLEYDHKMGMIDEEFLKEYIEENINTIEFMSKTIDDFRNFFRIDKEKVEFGIQDAVQKTIRMQMAQLNTHNIILNISGDNTQHLGLKSEFQQVILNIISNAKDALIEKSISNPKIDIEIKNTLITIKDNAGGIPKDIQERIFEPYFTTKEQGKGTGMGLYMSKMIIENNMGGILSVQSNDTYTIFSIKL